VALLTVGGLITALPFVSSDLRPSTPVTLVGVALVVAGGFLAWMSSGAPGSLGWMVLLTVAGFVASLALIPVPADGDAPLGGWGALLFVVRPVAAVAALVLIPWVFASATRWRRRREPARG